MDLLADSREVIRNDVSLFSVLFKLPFCIETHVKQSENKYSLDHDRKM